jgi:hypothetical protein
MHQLMMYSDDVNLLGENTNIIKRMAQAVFDASKIVVIEVNTEKNMHMRVTSHQNAGQNGDIKKPNK